MSAYRWGGGGHFWEPERRLSVLELVKYGTVDPRLASLLWLIMENRASVLVAAGPSFAGKTTLLNVMLDFLHPAVKQIHLQGQFEDFTFQEKAVPSQTYLVADEFSDHLAFDYVWGDAAQKAFQLLEKGYSLGGTIHARTAREVVYILHEYMEIPLVNIARLGVIITLRVTQGQGRSFEPVRRVDSVSLISPQKDGILIELIASRELGTEHIVVAGEKALQNALSRKFDISRIKLADELGIREKFLTRLISNSKVSRDDVRTAIVDFYKSRL